MAKFENMELAEWLEDAARVLLENNPKYIALAARLPDGRTLTAYYKAGVNDKIASAGQIHADAMLDMIVNNAGTLKEAMEETEEED